MTKELTWQEIIADLKSRGEHSIQLHEDGSIKSQHGKATINYWAVINGQLICIDCKTIYRHSI